MRRPRELRIVQLRKDMLYARAWPGVWVPATLAGALGLWMLAVWFFLSGFMLPFALLPLLASIALMVGMPFMLTNGAWLSVDRRRGWVHWQTCRWPRSHQESFSTHRLESLRIVRRGLRAPGLGLWQVELRLDHPRLPRVVVCSTLRLERAFALCRRMAAALELGWHDPSDLLHVAMRARMKQRQVSWHGMEWLDQLPPTPEIGLTQEGDTTRFILPADRRAAEGAGVMLLYALLWCLWAWTSLMYELKSFGPMEAWTAPQQAIIGGLALCSALGVVLLGRVMHQLLGEVWIEPAVRGWRLQARWLGVCWRTQLLRVEANAWVRRVDPPGEEAGLWLTQGDAELQIGRGLSADSLAWLQQLIAARAPDECAALSAAALLPPGEGGERAARKPAATGFDTPALDLQTPPERASQEHARAQVIDVRTAGT